MKTKLDQNNFHNGQNYFLLCMAMNNWTVHICNFFHHVCYLSAQKRYKWLGVTFIQSIFLFFRKEIIIIPKFFLCCRWFDNASLRCTNEIAKATKTKRYERKYSRTSVVWRRGGLRGRFRRSGYYGRNLCYLRYRWVYQRCILYTPAGAFPKLYFRIFYLSPTHTSHCPYYWSFTLSALFPRHTLNLFSLRLCTTTCPSVHAILNSPSNPKFVRDIYIYTI